MNILIVEDEARIARRIERMAQDTFGNELDSLKHADSLPEALEFIKNNPLDLLLLDLNLNGDNGFDILGTAVSESFHTIIISAHKDQAIPAFEYGVLDFVPKPFNRERLEQAFNRAIAKEKTGTHHVKLLAIKKRGRIQLIRIEDLLYCKGAGAYTELHLADGTKELHDKSLEKLEQLLLHSFERIHKSYLVKMSEVTEIMVKPGSKYIAELKNGENIPIGRTKYKDLRGKWV
ncbi:LytTR family transcriptional regulator DNA-binding domain-containing protein [Fulvivirga ulvae]|uniref:LytR/AlgR family response regulator transcription factor n=1 Tax=Fulvivirga ulvae TaxID=2904245 RepID=UPI001F3909E5|nr:response regulator transcription factor [Fulvivirga ulvae]UII31099.1 LytTR family transcriptional regulator DNA-binding domain-containing protein [Fulvivirga ulvae]